MRKENLKEFLHEVVFDPFLLGMLTVLVICIILLGMCLRVNHLNKIPEGTIISKSHTGGFYYWQDTGNGSGFLNYIPEEFNFIITDGNKKYQTDVSELDYSNYNEGEFYKVKD